MALRRILLLPLLALLLHSAMAATNGYPSAREVVMSTTEELIHALREKRDVIKEDMDTAYRLADETVIPHVDFPRITRWVTGKYWRSATPDQRERLTAAFRELLTRSYVTAMVTYADQILANADNVQYPDSRTQEDGKNAMVTMLIKLENNKDAVVQYQMYLSDDGWKIYDVKVEGVSLAITYRSSFSQEINRGGIDGLIAQLEARNKAAEIEPLPEVAP